MDYDRQKELEKTCSDIFQGVSEYKSFFIKHFNFFDQSKIDVSYSEYYNQAISEGIPTEKDSLQRILSNPKLWTKEKEAEIEICQKQIRMSKEQLKKAYVSTQFKVIEKALEQEEKKLNDLLSERKELIGFTAEDHANQYVNNVYVFNSFYKDRECKIKYLSEEEYEYLEDSKVHELTTFYFFHIKKFSAHNIQSVTVCPFFRNLFSICDNNPYSFYGKPVVDLTFFQSDLFAWGKYFSSIFSSELSQNMPQEILENPDEIIKWFTKTSNLRNVASKNEGQEGQYSVIGASSKDMREAGLKGGLDIGDGKKRLTARDFVKRGS